MCPFRPLAHRPRAGNSSRQTLTLLHVTGISKMVFRYGRQKEDHRDCEDSRDFDESSYDYGVSATPDFNAN